MSKTIPSGIEFLPRDQMILVFPVKLDEICAPAPDPDDQIRIVLGVFLSVDEPLPVHRIELKLMTPENHELPNERCDGFDPLFGIKDRRMELHRQRSAVDIPRHGQRREALYDREGTFRSDEEAGRKIRSQRLILLNR